MEEIGVIQRYAVFFFGIVWGTLAILISLIYFYCLFRGDECEGIQKWIQKKFNKPKKGKGKS
jgi:hypothetical protein